MVGALLALTLKIGRRGTHEEIRDDHNARKAQLQQKELLEHQQRDLQSQSETDQEVSEKTI